LIEINKEVYQKLAYRDTTEGVLAVAKTKSIQLSDLKLSKNPLILIAEAPKTREYWRIIANGRRC
jgi:TrmH family RNA methyltransferase